jgi:hypothetical protein
LTPEQNVGWPGGTRLGIKRNMVGAFVVWRRLSSLINWQSLLWLSMESVSILIVIFHLQSTLLSIILFTMETISLQSLYGIALWIVDIMLFQIERLQNCYFRSKDEGRSGDLL